jgi:hypothetical protein
MNAHTRVFCKARKGDESTIVENPYGVIVNEASSSASELPPT